MRLRQLEYVREAIRQRSLKLAANHLYVSEPTISQQIRALEAEIGLKLLQREGHGVGPTRVGQELMADIERVFHAIDQLERHISDVKHMNQGLVKIGTTHSGAMTILPMVLKYFGDTYPGVHMEIHEGHTSELLSRLASRQLDASIIATSPWLPMDTDKLTITPLIHGQLCVVCCAEDSLARKETISVSDLASRPLVLYRSGYLVRELCLQWLAGMDPLTKQTLYYTDNTESMREIVSRGMAVGFLPDFAEKGDVYVEARRVVFRPLAEQVPIALGMAASSEDYIPVAVKELLRVTMAEGKRFERQARLRKAGVGVMAMDGRAGWGTPLSTIRL